MFQETPKYVGEFFDAVLGERTGFLSIGSTDQSNLGTCSYRFFSADDTEAISAHINSLPKDSQVLFGLGRLENIPTEGRGKSEDVYAFSALAMDIDLHSEKKEHQNLPRTIDEAVELIRSFTLPPSIVVKSGTGCHAYWLLQEDVVITNPDEREAAKKLVANFHQGVNEFFAPTEFDHTQDIARVMRVPGFVNLKDPNAGLSVEILVMDTSVRYSLEEIISVSASRSRSKKPFRIDPPVGKIGELDFGRMVDGCKWLERSVSTNGVINHNGWFATGSLISLTKGGNERFHAWSAGSPDYEYEQAQAKYEQIDPDKARRTCSSLAAIGNAELCEGCVFSGGIQSPAELGESGMRAIHASGQQLPVLTAELWAAIHVKNEPSRIFARNGLLARVNEELGLIEVLDENSARHTFARVGFWVHPSKDQDGWGSHSLPNVAIIKDALATPFPPVPSLKQVTLVPVLTEQGKILDEYGYDSDSQIYYANNGSGKPHVFPNATREDAIASAQWIKDEVLGDFPFSSDSATAHAFALLIQPFVRSAINGTTPFYLIDKPVAGTGATLLARTLCYPYMGRDLPAKHWVASEDELRKQVTAHLLSGSNPYFFDNLEGKIDSNVLASVLTSTVHGDRILQRSQDVELDNQATWIGTGNNPTFAKQIARRIVRIRLVSTLADPTEATGFKHLDLEEWVRENRTEYIEHILTIIGAWANAGRPIFSGKPMASYVSWSQVIGGILEFAQIGGFLSDEEDKSDLVAESEDQAPGFIAEWFERFGEKPMTPKEIVANFVDSDISTRFDSHSEIGKATQAGTYMRGLLDRTFEVNTLTGKKSVRVTLKSRKWVVREVKTE